MKLKLTFIIAAIVALIMLMGWAGKIDYTDQVILSMSQEDYDTICSKLEQQNGSRPSETEIADYYMENR